MRHKKHKTRLNRTSSHKRALLRNLSKSLVEHERIVTTVEKAKELKKVFEPLVTRAKEDNLHNRRKVQEELGLHYNALSPKEARQVKEGNLSAYNIDRKVVEKLFKTLGPRYKERAGGYTRIVRVANRIGDAAETCVIECV